MAETFGGFGLLENLVYCRNVLLQSAERARDFARFDPITGKMDFFSEDGAPREQLQADSSGRFSFVEGALVVFYRDNGVLKLRIGDEEHVIDEETSSRIDKGRNRLIASLRRSRRHNQFLLTQNGETVMTFNYQAPETSNIPFDPTPFVEEEDFDFMLFIHHVLDDSPRRKDIWT
jgi:hypothetical protein